MDCRTCVYSDWDYPATECKTCRGYGNHSTQLPLPGICPGDGMVDELRTEDLMLIRVMEVCDTINELTDQMMFGSGDVCTRASRLLAMVGKAMQLNVHERR